MKEMKAMVLLLGLFVVAVLAFLVYSTTAKKTSPATATAVEQSAPTAAAPAVATTPPTESVGGGIRSSDLMAPGGEELPPPSTNAPAPGSSERLPRAYENAPPQIPHSIEGLVPITLGNNACLSCHLPGVAENVGATPISPTHIKMDLFSESEGKQVQVDPSRYACTQCHAPQAGVKPPVVNEFQPEFRNPELKNKSNLDQQWNEGVQ